MKRTIKFTLSFVNKDKLKKLAQLKQEYLRAVNFYIKKLSKEEKYVLSDKKVKKFNSLLSYGYKQCAYRQAEKIWKSWRRNYKKESKIPKFKGSMLLDQRFIRVQEGGNTFDYWVKISTLTKSKRTSLPIKSYNYANEYFKSWRLMNGCRLKKFGNDWILYLTFEKKTPDKKKKGKDIGIDIGIKKLITTSNRRYYGKNIEQKMDKIARKKQGSKAFKRALIERDEYINKIAKKLPFKKSKTFVVENIKNIFKYSKQKKKLRKEQRKKYQRWVYRKLFNRLEQLTEAKGVLLKSVNPSYTSQTCSECGFVHKLNRKGEIFFCRNCGYKKDADWNASKNILKSYLTQ